MSRKCEICGRATEVGYQVTRRGLAKAKGGVGRKITGKTKRTFKPNIQRVRAVVNGRTCRVKVCTRCMKRGLVHKPSPRPGKPQPVTAE
jgi:large subunit ribosomal protein L28